jgi:uncharacterized protein YdcH (DUF465 family)
MSHTPHELVEEFPGKADAIHTLRETDQHFRRLTDEYHEVNRAIHRAESRTEPMSEEHEEDLRRRRMHLKDEIATRLR